MTAAILPWASLVVVATTSIGLLVSRDWRWSLALLAVQYVGIAGLVAQHWPVGMAAAKLVTGWMATAALGMTLTSLPHDESTGGGAWPQGRSFRLFMAGMIVVVAAGVTPRLGTVMAGVGPAVIAGAILLAGLGLVQLGTTSEVSRVIIGLLTVLGGFETLYAGVEGSILVAGLLAVVNLGLGLVGAYLLGAGAPLEAP